VKGRGTRSGTSTIANIRDEAAETGEPLKPSWAAPRAASPKGMIGRIFGIGCSFAAFESGGGRASTGRAFALAAAFRIRARTSGLGAGEDVIAPRIRGEALPTTTLQRWESGTRPWGFTHPFRPGTAFRAVAAAVVAAGIAAAFRVSGGAADSTSSVRDAIPNAAARGRNLTGIAATPAAVSVLEGAVVVTGIEGIGGVSITIVGDAGAPAGGDEAVAAGGAGGVVTAGGAGWSLTMSFVAVGSAGLGSVAFGAAVPDDEEPAGDSVLGSASGAGAGASGLAVEVGGGVAAGGVSAGVAAAGGVSAGGGEAGVDSALVVAAGGGGGGASSARAVGTATSTATADASEVAPTRATQPARFPLAANGVSSVTEMATCCLTALLPFEQPDFDIRRAPGVAEALRSFGCEWGKHEIPSPMNHRHPRPNTLGNRVRCASPPG
jgi:hypothetical protein